VREVRNENGSYLLTTNDVSSTLADLMRMADAGANRVHSLHMRTATLEDAFISLTGRRLRD
jgi:hypothetical protein